jgi:hypothetical protein
MSDGLIGDWLMIIIIIIITIILDLFWNKYFILALICFYYNNKDLQWIFFNQCFTLQECLLISKNILTQIRGKQVFNS